MKKYFNVPIEFDKVKFDCVIRSTISRGGKGYVCAIESNNLTVANTDPLFKQVINQALVNHCDGSVLAKIVGKIHHEPFESMTGTAVFMNYIKHCTYRHYFLGNTPEILQGLRDNLRKIDPKIEEMTFEALPFRAVEDFDYKGIAQLINETNPDLIWVSLGAPKQELFMSKLVPYLNRGILFGVGAAFNFKAGVGSVKRAPLYMRKLRLEWLYRAFEQPQKNVPRYWRFIKILPQLIKEENQKVKRETGKV
ncbi:MAG: WecB/TagA/CpsF family glycosyltransferase [Massilibacteroides sp.]|nr:WecB/TagA/CpsF family glycosyltransferase [Massilibacteroides sp.]